MTVSVVIPTHKRPQLLKRLLQSIADQTYNDMMIHIIDDGSDEISAAQNELIASGFSPSMRIQYSRNSVSIGAPAARNLGIRQAQGDFICLTDDDDLWHPDKIAKQVSLFEKSSERIGLIYTWANVKNEKLEFIGAMEGENQGDIVAQLLGKNFIPSSSVMIRSSCFESSGLFDETLQSCQDWDMWLRLAMRFEVDVIPSPLTTIIKHGESSIGGGRQAVFGYQKFLEKHRMAYKRYSQMSSYRSHQLYVTKNLLMTGRITMAIKSIHSFWS